MECSKTHNFKTCKMSMGWNDTYESKGVKILKAKTKFEKMLKETKKAKKKINK